MRSMCSDACSSLTIRKGKLWRGLQRVSETLNIMCPDESIEKATGKAVAIKIIDLESAEDEIDDIQQEIQILGQLDSEFVTK